MFEKSYLALVLAPASHILAPEVILLSSLLWVEDLCTLFSFHGNVIYSGNHRKASRMNKSEEEIFAEDWQSLIWVQCVSYISLFIVLTGRVYLDFHSIFMDRMSELTCVIILFNELSRERFFLTQWMENCFCITFETEKSQRYF